MAPQNDTGELPLAWRALSGAETRGGWRVIPVASGASRFLAGRRHPGDLESVLIRFADTVLPSDADLPKGQGFEVARAEPPGAGLGWLALTRMDAGRLDVFSTMAADVVATVRALEGSNTQARLAAFLARVAAWQQFMKRGTENLLSPAAEIGLFGELVVLLDVIGRGLKPADAIDAWQGPLDGIHDFRLGQGAVEVKSTLAAKGFLARIDSLDQLDDSTVAPLFVAAQRLRLDAAGLTLPLQVEAVRTALPDQECRTAFDSRLVHAGFVDEHADRYRRCFLPGALRVIPIGVATPRLTRGTVPTAVASCRYELNLDDLTDSVTMGDALGQLGVINGAE